MKRKRTDEEILTIRIRDRAIELYEMLKAIEAEPAVLEAMSSELLFDMGRLISRIERLPPD